MQEIRLNNGVLLRLYTEASEMPLNRYMAFQRYLLLDAGIGSDMQAVNDHFSRLHQFLSSGMQSEAQRESENLHFCIFSILEEINFQSYAFGCRIHSIDNEVISDYSETALNALKDRLSGMGLTQEQAKATNEDAKKKIFETLKRYYPEFFPDDEQTEIFVKVSRRMELISMLIGDEGDDEGIRRELAEIDIYMLSSDPPQSFRADDPENATVKMDLQYLNLCSMMEGNGIQNAGCLSVLEFYSRLSYLKKQSAPRTAPK